MWIEANLPAILTAVVVGGIGFVMGLQRGYKYGLRDRFNLIGKIVIEHLEGDLKHES
jgi:hypothetical protein